MKALPTIWFVLDFVDLIPSRLRRSAKREGVNPHSSLSRTKAKAQEDYAEVAGSWVAKDYLETRNLVEVSKEEEAELARMGAEKVRGGWKVPKSIPDDKLHLFSRWMPQIPIDLREHEPKMLRTKRGRSIESYLKLDDMAKGDDSLATPLAYAAFPVLGALTYLLLSFGWFIPAIVSTVLIVPFLVALKQSESAGESIKCLFAYYLAPLAIASAFTSGTGAVAAGSLGLLQKIPVLGFAFGQLAETIKIGSDEIMTVIATPFVLLIPFTIVIVIGQLMFTFGENPTGTILGGFAEKLKHACKWAVVWSGLTAISMLLPPGLAAAPFFVGACFSITNYSEKNFLARGSDLKVQGEIFNLGSDPTNIINVAEKIRQEQIISASADKSPLIILATAQGHLAVEKVSYAPDRGVTMALSRRDLTMHVFGFGNTGKGKSTSIVRGTLIQIKAHGGMGGFIRDGKQTLAAEMRQIIDIMVEPGIRLALLEGLTAKQVVIALNTFILLGKGKDPLWENGAALLVEHAATIHEALVAHEKVFRQAAIRRTRALESQLDYLVLEMARMEKQGHDMVQARAAFNEVKVKHDQWAKRRDGDRKYLWNIDTLYRVINAINETELRGGVDVPGKTMREMADFLGYNAQERRMLDAPDTIHPDIGANTDLENSLGYVFGAWCALDKGQRSSFAMNVFMNCIIPLMRGKDFRDADGTPWSMLETGVDLGQALYGKWVGMNVNANDHGRSADLIQSLVRQRIYSGVLKRAKYGNKWMQALPGQLPLIDCCDECQLVVGKEEANMAPIGRSLGITLAFFTQGIENIAARFDDKNETAKFVNTFQSVIALDCSPETKHYLAERFGEVMKIKTPNHAIGLNYTGTLKKWHASPLHDLKHPFRAVMRKIELLGGGKLSSELVMGLDDMRFEGHRTTRRDQAVLGMKARSRGVAEFKPAPLFELNHFEMLKAKGTALVYLQRGGVPRVDVATLNYVSDENLDKMAADPVVVSELIKEGISNGLLIEEVMSFYEPPQPQQV